jgi:hypothetical protein
MHVRHRLNGPYYDGRLVILKPMPAIGDFPPPLPNILEVIATCNVRLSDYTHP